MTIAAATGQRNTLLQSMFTGLIEGSGSVVTTTGDNPGIHLTIAPPPTLLTDGRPTRIGDSVSINGCCLTVVEVTEQQWSFQAGAETLARTNLGQLEVGDRVNLERSLSVNTPLGGHFVQGHIDGVAHIATIERDGGWVEMWFDVLPELAGQLVSKGSVAIDGVSLTVVDVEARLFSVALIPQTLSVTTLGERLTGDQVNIETDIIGKYVQKFLQQRTTP